MSHSLANPVFSIGFVAHTCSGTFWFALELSGCSINLAKTFDAIYLYDSELGNMASQCSLPFQVLHIFTQKIVKYHFDARLILSQRFRGERYFGRSHLGDNLICLANCS
jgi:hypothetical protein